MRFVNNNSNEEEGQSSSVQITEMNKSKADKRKEEGDKLVRK